MKKISAIKPISEDLIGRWKDAKKFADSLEEDIVKRISYIVYTIEKKIGAKLYTWYFYDAPEGSVGSLERALQSEDTVSFVVEMKKEAEQDVAIIDGSEFSLVSYNEWCFPKRWLFEDFESELDAGIKNYRNMLSLKEKKKLEEKSRTEKLLKSAKAKLTRDELAAVKRMTK